MVAGCCAENKRLRFQRLGHFDLDRLPGCGHRAEDLADQLVVGWVLQVFDESLGRAHHGRYPEVSVPLSQPQVRPKVVANQAVNFLAENGKVLAEVRHVLWRDALLPAKNREVQDHVLACLRRPVVTCYPSPLRTESTIRSTDGMVASSSESAAGNGIWGAVIRRIGESKS